jgi:hypothetical protein
MSKEKKQPTTRGVLRTDRKRVDKSKGEEVIKAASSKRGPGRPKKTHDRVRFTTIIEPDLRRKIKAIAALTDNQIHDLVNQAIENYVSQYEKENGPIE